MKDSQRAEIPYGLIMLPAVVLLLLALALVPSTLQWHLLDLSVYANASARLLLGATPYKDYALEYPPGALFPFVLPRLLTFNLLADVRSYGGVFALLNLVYTSLVALVLAALASGQPTARRNTLVTYTLLVAIVSPLLPWRYDMFVALLTALALLAVQRERPLLAGVLLGLGVAAKLYPLVLIAALVVWYLAQRDWHATWRVAAGSIGSGVVVVLPFGIVAGPAMVSFLTYHEQRGVQLESVAGGVTLLAHALGLVGASTQFNYGAIHLVSPIAAAVLPWLLPLFVGAMAVVLLAWWRRFRYHYLHTGSLPIEQLGACFVAVLLVFMTTNKVLSPQYMIWVLPFAPLLRPAQRGLVAVMLACTMLLFPFWYNDLLAFQALPIMVLNVRNVLAIGLIFWLLLEPPQPAAHATAAPHTSKA